MINTYINEGKIVPAEVTVGLLKGAMEKAFKERGTKQFLVDGFPRDAGNHTTWDRIMSNICYVPFMLLLECPEKELERRLLHRGDEAGANRRSDDNIVSIRKRFRTYKESTKPVIARFAQSDNLRTV